MATNDDKLEETRDKYYAARVAWDDHADSCSICMDARSWHEYTPCKVGDELVSRMDHFAIEHTDALYALNNPGK